MGETGKGMRRAEAACGGKLIWSPGQWNLWNVTRIGTKTVIILADPAEYLEPCWMDTMSTAKPEVKKRRGVLRSWSWWIAGNFPCLDWVLGLVRRKVGQARNKVSTQSFLSRRRSGQAH